MKNNSVAESDEQPMFIDVRRLQRRVESLSKTYGFGVRATTIGGEAVMFVAFGDRKRKTECRKSQ